MKSNELFFDYKLQHELQYKLTRRPYEERLFFKSILHCKQSIIPKANYRAVDVMTRRRGNKIKAHFANLYNCKSLWSCPTCAAYGLSEHRDKITAIIEHQRQRGYWACMITYTVPHNNEESAATVFKRLKDMNQIVRPWQCLPHSAGSVTSTEFTYNDVTGWHPHLHVLYFIPQTEWYKLTEAVNILRGRVVSYFKRLGYAETDSMIKRCVTISMNNGTPRKILSGDYVAKEMAKLKTGRRRFKSRTPFELLLSNQPRDFDLFMEYAAVTKGRSRIQYSKNIQKGMDVTAVKAKKNTSLGGELVEAVVCTFTEQDWRDIIEDELATHQRHRRRILICACMGFDRVVSYCLKFNLPTPYPPMRQVVNVA